MEAHAEVQQKFDWSQALLDACLMTLKEFDVTGIWYGFGRQSVSVGELQPSQQAICLKQLTYLNSRPNPEELSKISQLHIVGRQPMLFMPFQDLRIETGWAAFGVVLEDKSPALPEELQKQVIELLCFYHRNLAFNFLGHDERSMAMPKLKPTSIKVLRLLAQGYATRQIAARVHLSERGVDYHLECLKQKLEARNRVHLIHKAHNLQLL